VLNAVTAGPQHVELEWQLPLDPGIRFAKIYRSHDGENYQAVAMCRISALKYLDFVPDANRTFHYKITWIDYKYNESPFSEPSKIRVPSYSDEALLESIQSAHINYFNRHAE